MVHDLNRQDAKYAKKQFLSLNHSLGALGVLAVMFSFSYSDIIEFGYTLLYILN